MSVGNKRKQPEDDLAAQTQRLEDLHQEIDAIIKHHGHVPANAGTRESYAAKLQERHNIQQNIMFPLPAGAQNVPAIHTTASPAWFTAQDAMTVVQLGRRKGTRTRDRLPWGW